MPHQRRKNKIENCLYKISMERGGLYQGCDKGLANKNFPKHTGGVIMYVLIFIEKEQKSCCI